MDYPYLVLDDKLFLFWNTILKSGLKRSDIDRAKKFFSFYRPHAINEEQYKRTQVPLDPALKTSIIQSSLKEIFLFTGSLEQLSLLTRLKIILCENDSEYPRVNINGLNAGEIIESNYTGTFDKVPREKCLNHLRALCKDALSVLICDKYLYVYKDGSPDDCKQRSLERVTNIMHAINPSTSCRVDFIDFYYDNNPRKNEFNNSPFKLVIDQLKQSYPSVDRRRYNGSKSDVHDRYMLIESNQGKMKVLFSSGFENLFDDTKDMTYIVRCL